MTRLEEIEAWLTKSVRSLIEHRPEHEMAHRLIYRGDCYRARVAVLEEALENYANKRNWANKTFAYQDPWLDAEETLALTPEECLERQSKHGEEG